MRKPLEYRSACRRNAGDCRFSKDKTIHSDRPQDEFAFGDALLPEAECHPDQHDHLQKCAQADHILSY